MLHLFRLEVVKCLKAVIQHPCRFIFLARNVTHDVFITTADSPLCDVEPETFFADPAGVLDDLLPGVGRLLRTGAVSLPPKPEWYTIERARRVLGYYPRHYFKVSP